MQKFIIKTKRLGLRFMVKNDFKYLEEIDKDPEVKKFFPEGTLSDGQIKHFISSCIDKCENKNLPCFIIFKLKTNECVGEAYFDKYQGETKVGYLYGKKFWHQGFAKEALQGLLSWAKDHIDAAQIIAYADVANKASIRVLESCGMRFYKKIFLKAKPASFIALKIDNCLFYKLFNYFIKRFFK